MAATNQGMESSLMASSTTISTTATSNTRSALSISKADLNNKMRGSKVAIRTNNISSTKVNNSNITIKMKRSKQRSRNIYQES